MAPMSVHFCPSRALNPPGKPIANSRRTAARLRSGSRDGDALSKSGGPKLAPACSREPTVPMQTYEDLVELAKICMRQARETKSRQVAAELRRMAKDYQKRAAELNSGKLPNLRD